MGKNKFSLDFDDFLKLADQVDRLGEGYLKQATENALRKSTDYVNQEVLNAMNKSKYSFTAGQGGSKGRTRASLQKVSQMPIEWEGTKAFSYIGVDLSEATEVIFLMNGTTLNGNPHIKADTKLKNAIKVKGKVKKKASEIQKEEFTKVIEEVMKKDD